MLMAELAGQPRAHVLGEIERVLGMADSLGDAFQDGRQVADRDAFCEQSLQHALNAGDRDLRGDELLDQLLLFRRQLVEQLLGLRIGQKLAHVGFEDFGQMRGEHGAGIDHGEPLEGGFLLQGSG